jgi:diguanylate cyclase (GGDEF)-like protein
VGHLLGQIGNSLSRTPRSILTFTSVALVLLVAVLDYSTGYEMSFAIFYLVPVSLAAWYIGRNAGLGMALVSAAVWQIANKLAGEVLSNPLLYAWNMAVRVVVYSIVVVLLHDLRVALTHERRLARTDPLTGIMNRRAFHEELAREILRVRRHEYPLTIAYIDLDDFKAMNDRFGHSTGDTLLRTVAGTIDRVIRDTDVVARIGGDEFAILFPDTDTAGAEKVLVEIQEHLRQALDRPSWKVTFSIGAITCWAPSTIEAVLRDVDRVMYSVKRTGKNAVRLDNHTC